LHYLFGIQFRIMRLLSVRGFLCIALPLAPLAPLAAQTEFVSARDPHEVRLERHTPAPDAASQRRLRDASA